jgi:catechol 2,3-dioxygenase-like lactoylglutathione lyase family enzyme
VPGLDHFLVLTDDIDGTRDFWCEVLGLEVGRRPPLEFPGYWLYSGDRPCVHIAERSPYVAHSGRVGIPAATGPVEHVAFDGADREQVTERLRRSRVPAIQNEVPGVMRQYFVEDPNGVKIEINVKEPK